MENEKLPNVNTTVEILSEIKRILLFSEETETNCLSVYQRDDVVSLYEVATLLRKEINSYLATKSYYLKKLENAYKNKVKGKREHLSSKGITEDAGI